MGRKDGVPFYGSPGGGSATIIREHASWGQQPMKEVWIFRNPAYYTGEACTAGDAVGMVALD